MGKMPKIHRTEAGKRYIIVNGKRVILLPGMTNKEILSIYLLLKRTIPKKRKKKRYAPKNVAQAIVNIRPDSAHPDRSVSVASSNANERDQLESAINKVNQIMQKEQMIPHNQAQIAQIAPGHNKFKRSRSNLLPIGNSLRNPRQIVHDLEQKDQDEGINKRAQDDLQERKKQFRRKEQERKEEDKHAGFSSAPPHSSSSPGLTKAELQQERQRQRRKRRGDVESNDPSSSGSAQLEELRRRETIARSESKSPYYSEHANIPDITTQYNTPQTLKIMPAHHGQPYLFEFPSPKQRHVILPNEMKFEEIQYPPERGRRRESMNQRVDNLMASVIGASSHAPNDDLSRPFEELKIDPSNESDEKGGNGLNKQSPGLYDDQIDKVMDKFKDYHGSIMRDQIKKLLPDIKPQSRVAFIINTQPSDKPGQHWCAVYIDARNGPESSNSLEWFDSFARPMPADIREDCKLILKILKPETILKLKENSVVQQSDDSSNCGYFCMRFLIDRFRGQSFSSATGYDQQQKIDMINKNEAEIEKMKHSKPFNYISV